MDDLHILMIASEAAPYARTGGLGDVMGALPSALSKLGHTVKVCMPRYKSIDRVTHRLVDMDWSTSVRLGDRVEDVTVDRYRDPKSKVEYYFIGNDHYFNRGGLYQDPRTGEDYEDNDERFAFFSRASLELARHLEFRPDIVHLHDWQTSAVPAYLTTVYDQDAILSKAKTVVTIHNLGYQGVFSGDRFHRLGLPENYNYAVSGPFEYFGKVNFLKAGIVLADALTTVSPKYAEEICTSEEFGAGLEGVLRERRERLHGILNGVDYTVWSPSRDKKIPYRFATSNLSGKRMTRVELLNQAGMPIREKSPLIGIISRLVDQKGWDLIAEAADRLFEMDIQMIALGTGDEKYHKLLQEWEQRWPDKVKAYLKFDDELAHWIEAGADVFLMPSKYEPCGLNQLYSLKYGTVPIVREVGGLADTVVDFNKQTGEGTGFVFKDYTVEAMLGAIERAVDHFQGRRAWTKLMKAGMAQDFSWSKSAQRYAELFGNLVRSQ